MPNGLRPMPPHAAEALFLLRSSRAGGFFSGGGDPNGDHGDLLGPRNRTRSARVLHVSETVPIPPTTSALGTGVVSRSASVDPQSTGAITHLTWNVRHSALFGNK